MPAGVRIAVVECDPIYRTGVVEALKAIAQINVVAQGATVDDALRLCVKFLPDIIFLDIRIEGDGISAIRAIASASPATKIIILTSLDGEDYVRSVLQAGVRAYILKSIAGPQLIETVHAVGRGETLVSPTLAARLFSGAGTSAKIAPRLTHREDQVLDIVVRGFTNKEVALELGLSEKTVKQYMSTIYEKLGVRNRVEAVILSKRIKRPS